MKMIHSQVNLDDHETLKKVYLKLYDAYEQLGKDYRKLNGIYKNLLYDYKSLTVDYNNTLSMLNTTRLLSERQSRTITNLQGEITSLLALIKDLRKKKHPLLNFAIDGFAGYSGSFFLQAGLSWMPLQKGWFKAGLFGECGYVFFDGFTYRFGIKMIVYLFGD